MHTQEYALGHEIVHNWWGNGVFVDWEKGNWCEGLTTYCANYYWLELQHGVNSPEAVEYRRKALQRYKIYVTEENDYEPVNFTSKKEETDNEVGYTKMMMFFHQLRLVVGRETFFSALRSTENILAKRHPGRISRKCSNAYPARTSATFSTSGFTGPDFPHFPSRGLPSANRKMDTR
ncbi:MAG: M1 family aminopeptidase [Planctomycetota bacterium]|nr:M1 family aminopeptidase [Planctomycetota bacterium]